MSVLKVNDLTSAIDLRVARRAKSAMNRIRITRTNEAKSLLTRLVILAALFAPVGLVAQDVGPVDQAQKVRDALPREVSDQIESIVRAASESGIPAGPLYDKALEGAAKRIPGPRIVPAVSAYADRLMTARRALGFTQERWIVAGADALSRGVSPDALTRVAQDGRPGGLMAVVILGDLVESGVPSDHALEVVSEAVRSGQEEADMGAISGTVDRMIREGDAPPDAAKRLVRHMQRGLAVRRMRDVRPDLVRNRPGPPVAPGADADKKPRIPGG